jgi:segregation and condensation protein B
MPVPDEIREEALAPARDAQRLQEILEALVFVHRGILPPKTVHEVLGEEFPPAEIEAAFSALQREYERRGGAIRLLAVAGGWQLGTEPQFAEWIQRLDFYEHHRHLSRPALETLAIIAYKQPVTRAEIEAIRGVNVERIVRTLLEKKLVKILGHKDVPGKPMVVGTTKEFLQLFGLNSLADLPPLKEFMDQPAMQGEDDAPMLAMQGEDRDDAEPEAADEQLSDGGGSAVAAPGDEGPPGGDEDLEA